MKNKWIPILLTLFFAGVLSFVVFSGKKAPRMPLDEAVLHDDKGKIVSFEDKHEEVKVVSYFQTWCGECRSELLELQELQQKAGGDSKLKIYLITDEGWDRITIFKNSTKTPFPILQSEKNLHDIGIRRFPTTYLLDKKGQVVDAKVEGIHWNTPEIQQKILKLNN